jgi:hypothetical protein
MNKKYLAILIVVIVAGIVVQNVFATSPNINKDVNTGTSVNNSSTVNTNTNENANVGPFANAVPSTGVSTTTSTSTVTERAKTQLIKFISPPYNVTYDINGIAKLKLLPQSRPPFYPISVDGYRQVCVEIESSSHSNSFDMMMGVISELSFGYAADKQLLGPQTQCYPIKGPEIAIQLHGDSSTNDKVALWVYLIS